MTAAAHPDPRRHRLRGLVTTLEGELEALTGDRDKAKAACQELVAALDLGPDPATRACPKCKELGMANATLCGHCWTVLAAA